MKSCVFESSVTCLRWYNGDFYIENILMFDIILSHE